MIRRQVTCGAASLAMLAFIGSGCGSGSEKFRYRLTVEVETPLGLHAGSSVIELDVSDPGERSLSFPNTGSSVKVRGEAVAIDMPDGRTMFALLRKSQIDAGAVAYPYDAFPPGRYAGDYAAVRRAEEVGSAKGVGSLPRGAYPLLVAFDDLADPSSVREIDPDHLDATFGDGVKLHRIIVEITDEPVTASIRSKVPWLAGAQEEAIIEPLDLRDFSLKGRLRKYDFWRET